MKNRTFRPANTHCQCGKHGPQTRAQSKESPFTRNQSCIALQFLEGSPWGCKRETRLVIEAYTDAEYAETRLVMEYTDEGSVLDMIST